MIGVKAEEPWRIYIHTFTDTHDLWFKWSLVCWTSELVRVGSDMTRSHEADTNHFYYTVSIVRNGFKYR